MFASGKQSQKLPRYFCIIQHVYDLTRQMLCIQALYLVNTKQMNNENLTQHGITL